MRIEQRYSHLNGWEFIKVHKPHLWEEIEAVVAGVDAESCKTKESQEFRSQGKMFYSAPAMNAAMKSGFGANDWTESRAAYWVTDSVELIEKTLSLNPAEQKRIIEAAGKRAIYSYNLNYAQNERSERWFRAAGAVRD
jgi:hypothetical protein